MSNSEPLEQTICLDRPKRLSVFQFLKDWGPVITLIIAVFYTFPTDAFVKWTNWEARNTVAERLALTKIEELLAGKLMAMQQLASNPQNADLAAKSFNIRSYNILINNLEIFKKAIPQLSTPELYAIGSNLTMASLLPESIPFYEEALARSKDSDHIAFAAASREYGWALFSPSKVQDVELARLQYLHALDVVAKKTNYVDPTQFLSYLSELSLWEMTAGDWKCGANLLAYTDVLFDEVAITNPTVLQMKNYYDEGAKAKVKSRGQAENGCRYTIPHNEWLN